MTIKWYGPAEKCSICDRPFEKHFIDGKTRIGYWALMCRQCHRDFGIGLGQGRGQLYRADNKERVAG